MATVEEKIKEKIAKAKKWEEENPGLSWYNQEYAEEEGKIYITRMLLKSSVYRSLSRVAMLLYQDFLSKRVMKQLSNKKWVCENNGKIIFTFSEALKLGYSKKQFRNGIDELQQKGLLDIKHQGKGGRKPAKGAGNVSRYWIDDRWKKYGTDDFKPAKNPRKKDTRQGRGWALLMNNPKRKKEILQKRKEILSVKKNTR